MSTVTLASASTFRLSPRRPMTSALAQIAALGPSIKALVGFVGFVVALISLSALRNFGPVLFYVGLAIFAAVGLVIAGAIMGAVV